MNPSGQFSDDNEKPVAYTPEGQPLYARPLQPPELPTSHVTVQPDTIEGQNFDPKLRVQYSNEPSVIHASRAISPPELPVNEEQQRKHERSKREYPSLNLSEGEFVITMVQRHPIGLLIPVVVTMILVILLLSFGFSYPYLEIASELGAPNAGIVAMAAVLLSALVALGGYIIVWVYLQNKFYLTNESVIQEIQHSLFSKHEQTVSLGSIEDASFRQTSMVQTFFNYGSIRLSTEGEETTYRFQYVANPKRQIAQLNNAVEAFKNGRPVTGD